MRLILIFILAQWFAAIDVNAQDKIDLKFDHINSADGLSHSYVLSIHQDHMGYMWFGTVNGLNRWDGYSMKVYRNIPKDASSLAASEIHRVFEDSRKNLWVCTEGGVCLYDRTKDRFIRKEPYNTPVFGIHEDSNNDLWIRCDTSIYKYDYALQVFENEYLSAEELNITKLLEDSRGTLWIGAENGIYTYDRKTKAVEKVIATPTVHDILEDRHNNLWFACYSAGLYLFDRDNGTHRLFSHNADDPNSLPSNMLLDLEEDRLGRLWIGAQNSGLSIFDYRKNKFHNFVSNEGDPESLSFNTVNISYKDKSGNMWLGTFSGGVDLAKETKFAHFKTNALTNHSLSNNNILAFCEDSSGNIWIGTDGGGLNLFDKTSGAFKRFSHDPDDPNSISADAVTYITKDGNGNLWIGYWAGGLDMYDIENNRFVHYKHDESDPNSLISDNVMYLYNDKKNNLWVGTTAGLNRLDKKTKTFISYRFEEPGLRNYPGCMLEDKEGNLWYGTWNGLNLLDAESGETVYFSFDEKDSLSLSNNRIYTIHEDGKGRMWLGTASGLNLFDRKRNTFKAFYESDGLPSNVIFGILEDDDGNLWLSTGNGLCKFNPETGSTKNFNIHDGLQNNEFKLHAYLKLSSGEMLFGGANGFNMFHPDKIKENPHIPPLVITDFKIFNASVSPDVKNSPLKTDISQAKEITLTHNQTVFSFEFAALNYLSPEKNQYAYTMEGFDKKWNYVGNVRSATYTNLDPGKYTFRVKGSNNDGLWNEAGTSIDIIIAPPFWQTWWFRIMTAMTAIIGAVNWYGMRVRNIKKRNQELEDQVKARTHEISRQKDELKKQSNALKALYTDIKDSIRAAEVIQQSIFPPEGFIKEYLPESFILNKPKDVVSGDFYWFEVIDDKLAIAAVDCTGHGVSGAFMSIIGQSQLKQAIHTGKVFSAAEILDRLNTGIIKSLAGQKESVSRYGMDISLCIIDRNKKQMQFSGANIPLYILRNKTILSVQADKYPIGMTFLNQSNKFSNNTIDLQTGDIYYIFTDGYADQIGGPDQEKFMYKRLRELLIEVGHKPMDRQKEILEKTFVNWQGKAEQLDDVMMIGFKV